jgi:hypothetical protein
MKPFQGPGPIQPAYPPHTAAPPSVWYYAKACDRDYITPEDVDAAREAGADINALRLEVLVALSRGCCEDWGLSAFVAAKENP